MPAASLALLRLTRHPAGSGRAAAITPCLVLKALPRKHAPVSFLHFPPSPTRAHINALGAVHAATHPHGRLTDGHELNGPVNSSAKLGPSASIETSYAPVDSSSPSADPMLSPQSVMTACALLPVIPTNEVEERPQSCPADPPDDDPPAGTATKPPSAPPQGPEGKNQHNCLGFIWLKDKPDSTPGMGVTYYGYRWLDPVTGRWPSRDLIGEIGGVNMYGFGYNAPLEWIDLLGLNPMPTVVSRSTADERRRAFRKARYPNHGGSHEDYLVELERIVTERESRTGIVEVHTEKESCQCGDLFVRLNKSRWGGGWESDWIKLEDGGNAGFDPHPDQEFQAIIKDGTCDSYQVVTRQERLAEDVNINNHLVIATRHASKEPKSGEIFDLNVQRKNRINGPQDSMIVTRSYEIVNSEGRFIEKLGVVVIQVTGSKNGFECCKKRYRIK